MSIDYPICGEITKDDIRERLKLIENKVGKVYGVRRAKSNNTSPTWERIIDSVGLEANATHDGTAVTNDLIVYIHGLI